MGAYESIADGDEPRRTERTSSSPLTRRPRCRLNASLVADSLLGLETRFTNLLRASTHSPSAYYSSNVGAP